MQLLLQLMIKSVQAIITRGDGFVLLLPHGEGSKPWDIGTWWGWVSLDWNRRLLYSENVYIKPDLYNKQTPILRFSILHSVLF